MTALIIIAGYLVLLLALGLLSNRFFKGTAADYFLASRGIGSFLLLMSLFGTTMTAFAMIGSSAEAYEGGIGVYGMMASWSGIIHSLCFFLVGIKLWALGKRYGYVTQIQFFRARFESNNIGLVLFPILVGLIIPYLLMGVIGAGRVMNEMTVGALPEYFSDTRGGVPASLGAAIICGVVLIYVFFGGVRGTAWANTFQTIVFIVLGGVAFALIAGKLGGADNATKMVIEKHPTKLQRAVHPDDEARYDTAMAVYEVEKQTDPKAQEPHRPHSPGPVEFFTYFLIPFSVGMFPHLFQHWLTAKSAKSFRLAVVAHPLLIMIVWVPCVMIGVWATSAVVNGVQVVPDGANPNAVLPMMVRKLSGDVLGGFLAAGVLAAIMSSLDSQFLCVGSIFTNDIVNHYLGRDRLSDRQRVICGRVFVVLIVIATYLISQIEFRRVFTLGVWCFSGFASLFPLVFASLYWRRVTKAGAYASIFATAVTWLYFFMKSGYGANRTYVIPLPVGDELGVMPVTVIFAASAIALVVVSLITRPPSQATVDKFFRPIVPR